ncbi:MAG: hypothetical protein ACKPKO_65320, partial [Candidatus Fonsibacter sp.]
LALYPPKKSGPVAKAVQTLEEARVLSTARRLESAASGVDAAAKKSTTKSKKKQQATATNQIYTTLARTYR